jgi:hypothetical protein
VAVRGRARRGHEADARRQEAQDLPVPLHVQVVAEKQAKAQAQAQAKALLILPSIDATCSSQIPSSSVLVMLFVVVLSSGAPEYNHTSHIKRPIPLATLPTAQLEKRRREQQLTTLTTHFLST